MPPTGGVPRERVPRHPPAPRAAAALRERRRPFLRPLGPPPTRPRAGGARAGASRPPPPRQADACRLRQPGRGGRRRAAAGGGRRRRAAAGGGTGWVRPDRRANCRCRPGPAPWLVPAAVGGGGGAGCLPPAPRERDASGSCRRAASPPVPATPFPATRPSAVAFQPSGLGRRAPCPFCLSLALWSVC